MVYCQKLGLLLKIRAALKPFGVLRIARLVMILSLLTGCKPQHSPEYQALHDKFDQIEEEMTEEQVDAILSDHRSSTTKEIIRFDGAEPFKRPSSMTKSYSRLGAKEGDYVVRVYFDVDGYVVGKSIKGILK
jgi:hypothetical protein